MSKRIIIFDTTLRDGEQSPGIRLNVQDKLEIAFQLVKLGVDVIEAGFPATSPGDFRAVKAIAEKVNGPVICSLARAKKEDILTAANALRNCRKPRLHTFVNTSDIQMKHQLHKTRYDVLAMTQMAVRLAKDFCRDVEFSPMDATRSNVDFLCNVLETAIMNGATVINIPDTVGYDMPFEFGDFVRYLMEHVSGSDKVEWSVHCHNDFGLATANSIMAIKNGVTQVECTVNGLGERAGNAALEEIAMVIDTRKDILNAFTNINTIEIAKTSKLVSRLTGYAVPPNKAIIGGNAFAHTSGIHQDGVIKERTTFEIMDPKRIGLEENKIILGKTSGRSALRKHLAEMGFTLDDESLNRAFLRFKDLADKKSIITGEDLEAIAQDEKRVSLKEIFSLESLKTSGSTEGVPRAFVKLKKDRKIIKAKAEGDGQVDAACKAISYATGIKAKLLVYNVSSITPGVDSQGEVTIHLKINNKRVIGRGVATDVIEASARAYLNAIHVFLHLKDNSSGG